jgi:hypothetical protein
MFFVELKIVDEAIGTGTTTELKKFNSKMSNQIVVKKQKKINRIAEAIRLLIESFIYI